MLGLLIGLTFPAWKALRHPGMISGHDSESAVFKSEEFFNALKDGHFPPRWAKRLNYGLGQPTFTFSYTLPYYLTSILMGLGLSPVWAFKVLMAASFPVGAWFMFLWLEPKFGKFTALAGGLLYAYLPYHLANVYVRGAIGEVVAATLLPLSFWALDKRNPAVVSMIVMAVILSHPFYGLIFGLVWIGYAKAQLGSIGWGYINSAFYIRPALAFKNLTFLSRIEEYFLSKKGFMGLDALVYSPWSFEGVSATGDVGMSVQLGIVAFILFLGYVGMRKHRYFLWVFVAAVIMMLEISWPIWKMVPPLQALQFPWRMLFVATFAMVFGATVFVSKIKYQKTTLILIWLALVTTTKDFAHVNRYYIWTDPAKESLGYRGTYTLLLEETPKWHSIYDEFNALHKYEPIKTEKGDFTLISSVWKTNYHKFEVDTTGGILSDKTHYWPGWRAYVDGREVKLFEPTNSFSHGLLTMEVPAGKHVVETKLTEPTINKLANSISLIGIGMAVLTMIRFAWRPAYET